MVTLNNTLDQVDLIGIHRNFHPKESKYAFFLNLLRTLQNFTIYCFLKQVSTNLKGLKSHRALMFFDHSVLAAEINNVTRKSCVWQLRNTSQ